MPIWFKVLTLVLNILWLTGSFPENGHYYVYMTALIFCDIIFIVDFLDLKGDE